MKSEEACGMRILRVALNNNDECSKVPEGEDEETNLHSRSELRDLIVNNARGLTSVGSKVAGAGIQNPRDVAIHTDLILVGGA